MTDNVTDTIVAEHQETVPRHFVHPSVKYNPLYYIKKADTVTVDIKLNGNSVQTYNYNPNDTVWDELDADGKCLLFVAKMAIVESTKVIEE